MDQVPKGVGEDEGPGKHQKERGIALVLEAWLGISPVERVRIACTRPGDTEQSAVIRQRFHMVEARGVGLEAKSGRKVTQQPREWPEAEMQNSAV